jgi:hypothetical protein
MQINKPSLFERITQILLPMFTITGFLATSMKEPQIGLALNLFAQIFWLYSGWKAWKKANQIGIFINSIIITLILLYGVLNYWVFDAFSR